MAISFKVMTYFTSAVRKGNIAKAAADLNIAAYAVSNAIDQVEAVFDSTTVTWHTSESQRSVYRSKFDRLLEEYRSLMVEGVDLKQALSGTLRIGYYAPIAPAFLPDVILSCVPNPMDVVLHLQNCDNDSAQEGLLNGTYDAIFLSQKVCCRLLSLSSW